VIYLGVDISPVMINLATSRLAAWAERAKAVLIDGSLPLPVDDGFADRVLPRFSWRRRTAGRRTAAMTR
ncbi:MAG: class I SAM-dependent methyltransferase, partial [Mycobacterium sp.]